MLLTELKRVAARDQDNPHPKASDPDGGWIYEGDPADAESVVKDILGADVTTDEDNLKPGMFLLSRTWWNNGPIFSNMDEAPGLGGAIGLRDVNGKTPRDIAEAAHEAYHALLHKKKKNSHNEHLVNKLATRWLQDHLSGIFLHAAIESILESKRSYKHKKYPSSKKWLADYIKKFGDKDIPK